MARLDKPIIHFQIPHDENGEPAVELATVDLFMSAVAECIGKDKCHYIATPFNIDIIGADVEKVKVDEMSLDEFLKKHDYKGGIKND